MHKKFSNPPLTYVLAQVKISAIEMIEQYIPHLQESIRDRFPIFDKREVRNVEISASSEPKTYVTKQWHFKDKESLLGIMIDSKAINIHTSKYEGFNKFLEQMTHVLTEFNKQLRISLSTRIGLRYINIIDSNIDKNIQKNLLGFQLQDSGEKFLSKTETIQQIEDGYIKISSNHIGNSKIIGNTNNILVAPDLVISAETLSFAHHKSPDGRYLMLDIDGFCDESFDFDVQNIKPKLTNLHDNVYEVFAKSITANAKKEWQ
ncbi:MAG: TIGR04255 family protein [Gammaproteobacteria bacterium]|nr:TIGR04255 family protein [Gammaproteobacteria bacterium]